MQIFYSDWNQPLKVRHKEQKEHSKQKELKAGIRKFNQNPKKGLQLFIDNNQIQDDPKVSFIQNIIPQKTNHSP